jgi:uncharacterized protein YqgC (DUF456 family)
MSTSAQLLVGLLMVVGVVGVVVPVLPGLLLTWAAGLVWVWQDGGGPVRVVVGVVLTALLLGGTAAKYVLPARSASGAGAPRSTLFAGVVGAVAGFFLIPLAGVVVGGVGAVYLAELRRLRDGGAAGRSTWAVLKAVGIGMLVELTAALLMFGTWLLGVWLT